MARPGLLVDLARRHRGRGSPGSTSPPPPRPARTDQGRDAARPELLDQHDAVLRRVVGQHGHGRALHQELTPQRLGPPADEALMGQSENVEPIKAVMHPVSGEDTKARLGPLAAHRFGLR